MQQFKEVFDTYIGAKSKPNIHEEALFKRAEKYIQKIANIPGIEMIAVCNSLSMYATHRDSDIDLFIITKPGMLWYVRFFVTLRFWQLGVWRRGEDISENFCLSFFITTDAMDLSKIAIENDIYLYYWIYYLKPVLDRNNTYEKFIAANSWVGIDERQKQENLSFVIHTNAPLLRGDTAKREGGFVGEQRVSGGQKRQSIFTFINSIIRLFLKRKTERNYQKLGRPQGVIISDTMLKFHDQDKRKEIRDAILAKNFDK